MAKSVRLDPHHLRELLEYNPETGNLYWKPRSRERFASERSFGQFNTLFAGKEALSCDGGNGYLTGLVEQTKQRAHRVAWAIYYGEWPDQIDHINHDRSDNRIANLRAVTKTENARNQRLRKDNTTGRTGVNWHGPTSKWRAAGRVNGRATHLGLFETF
jgi:hypothetical protein